jgi:hypothetical protein
VTEIGGFPSGRSSSRAESVRPLDGHAGLLVCPTCSGHFEAFKSPWKPDGEYRCATARRKPGKCNSDLRLSMPLADDAVLDVIEHEVLDDLLVEELLLLVDRGEPDDRPRLVAERERLDAECNRLTDSVATGNVPAHRAAPKIREYESKLAAIEAQLRAPRRDAPDLDQLRAALTERTATWRVALRREPDVARQVVRRLIQPMVMHDTSGPSAKWVEWQTSVTTDVLDGLYNMMASPTGFEPVSKPGLRPN